MAAKVYVVADENRAAYFGTKRAARRFQSGMEEPERIVPLDAAEECERLDNSVRVEERARIRAEVALKELIAVAPMDLLRDTAEGREAIRLMREADPEFIKGCGL